jgi:hypothetical protein
MSHHYSGPDWGFPRELGKALGLTRDAERGFPLGAANCSLEPSLHTS